MVPVTLCSRIPKNRGFSPGAVDSVSIFKESTWPKHRTVAATHHGNPKTDDTPIMTPTISISKWYPAPFWKKTLNYRYNFFREIVHRLPVFHLASYCPNLKIRVGKLQIIDGKDNILCMTHLVISWDLLFEMESSKNEAINFKCHVLFYEEFFRSVWLLHR